MHRIERRTLAITTYLLAEAKSELDRVSVINARSNNIEIETTIQRESTPICIV